MKKIECQSLSRMTQKWSCEFSCEFKSREWHVLCGGSGAGKSTLLHLMMGLLPPDAGDILLDGKSICGEPPHKRGMSLMSQVNTLFPGMSVFDNLMLALHDSEMTLAVKKHAVHEMTENLALKSELLSRHPSQLSGGELSRCNLARALLRPCQWLLLDEPFAAVDRPTRLAILSWIRNWQKHTGSGIVLVSHDLDDIFTVATHVTVISTGRVVENAAIETAIESPRHTTTARLLRSGIVMRNADQSYFVSSKYIRTSRDQVNCEDHFIQSLDLKEPQTTNTGSTMRIIDLSDGLDLSLPAHDVHISTLWFDSRQLQAISGS